MAFVLTGLTYLSCAITDCDNTRENTLIQESLKAVIKFQNNYQNYLNCFFDNGECDIGMNNMKSKFIDYMYL